MTKPSISELARQVSLLALDCDGVLTDGRLYYIGEQHGEDVHVMNALAFNAQDGHAMKMLMHGNIEIAVISGRGSSALEQRMHELGITHVYSKVRDKASVLRALAHRLNLAQTQIAAMGDDIPDLSLFRAAGLSFAPSDAHPVVRERADHVTAAGGGRGCVREVAQLIMTAQGSFDALMNPPSR